MTEIDESSYLRFLRGDTDALEELIRTYADHIVRFAYSYVKNADVAEEVMEDTFAALFMKARKVRDEHHLRAYLFKIARNKCIDHLRHHRNCISLNDVEYALSGQDLQHDYFRQERDRMIYICMQRLPADYREVLQLTYFDAFCVQEICTVMGKSAKQVYNLLARAKESLKELLVKEGIGNEDLS